MEDTRPGSVVQLPSKGKPYGGAIPNGNVTVFSMKTTEEKLFGGISKRMDFENVIDTLIRRCSNIPESLKSEELYIGDRVFLMLNIRAASYGANYTFQIQCPNCRARWDHTMDLTKDLDIRDLSEDWQDPFELELPQSRDVVSLRLFRGTDERAIITYVDRANKKVNLKTIGDPGYTYRLALHLVGMKSHSNPENNFDTDLCELPGSLFANAQAYIENLSAQDSSAVREEIDNRTPGVNLQMDVSCPKCAHDFELALPMSADFFRASQSASGLRPRAGTVSRQTR